MAMHQLLIFNDDELLRQALTHRSFINENTDAFDHNERLEFLRDAILTFISGEYLYRQNPQLAEDEMTRRRAALVDEKQLARFASELQLDAKIRLGKGAQKEGGLTNPNILSSTFEAVVGAYYLDHNRDIAALRPLIEELFDSVPKDVMVIRSSIDPKNKLQEFVQSHGTTALPQYVTAQIGGTSHAPEFLAKVYVSDKVWGEGKGRNKKDAEKEAATDALTKLQKVNFL